MFNFASSFFDIRGDIDVFFYLNSSSSI
jgi:hypothetical protein